MSRKVIIVVGMHRSGTSILSKALNCLGVNMGDKLIPADKYNQKGYWEDAEIVLFNNRLLSHFGYQWDTLGLKLDSAKLKDCLKRFQDEAIKIVNRRTSAGKLWGFKDPRISRLLPFWNTIFKELNITPLYIISSRTPAKIAESLKKRDQFSNEKSMLLWLEHMSACVNDSVSYGRLVVDNNQLLQFPERELKKIAYFISGENEIPASAIAEFVDDFLDTALIHSNNKELLGIDQKLNTVVFELYEIVAGINDGLSNPSFTFYDSSEEGLNESEYVKGLLLEEVISERDQLKLMYFTLEKAIAIKDTYIDSLKNEYETSISYIDKLKSSLEEVKSYPDSLLVSLDTSRKYVSSLISESKQRHQQIDSLTDGNTKNKTYITSLESHLEIKDKYIQDLERITLEKDNYAQQVLNDNKSLHDYVKKLKI